MPAGQVVPTTSGGGHTRLLAPSPPAAGRIDPGAIEAPATGAGVQPLANHVASKSAEKLGAACMLTTTQFCVVVR